MFRLDECLKVYLHRAPVDLRLSINGLATLVQQALGLDPFAACVLEEGRFIWPDLGADDRGVRS